MIKSYLNKNDVKEYVNKTEEKLTVREMLPLVSNENPDNLRFGTDGSSGMVTIINDATERDECKRIVCLSVYTNTGSDKAAKNLLQKYGYNYNDYYIIKDEKPSAN